MGIFNIISELIEYIKELYEEYTDIFVAIAISVAVFVFFMLVSTMGLGSL